MKNGCHAHFCLSLCVCARSSIHSSVYLDFVLSLSLFAYLSFFFFLSLFLLLSVYSRFCLSLSVSLSLSLSVSFPLFYFSFLVLREVKCKWIEGQRPAQAAQAVCLLHKILVQFVVLNKGLHASQSKRPLVLGSGRLATVLRT